MSQKSVLSNGIRVITKTLPHLYSVATSVWCNIGSVNEAPLVGGASHLLEHMLFKGTVRRNAKEIAKVMEMVGGQMNAFTNKEYTCYYTRCLSEHFRHSMDLLSDVYLNSILAEEEFNREKKVVLEEFKMYEDTPSNVVHDLLAAAMWGEHAYGRPVSGNRDTVSSITVHQLRDFYQTTWIF